MLARKWINFSPMEQIPGINKCMYKITDQVSRGTWIHCKDPSKCWLLLTRKYNMDYFINSIKMELNSRAQDLHYLPTTCSN
ncbi:hypothetical protein IMY05_006G0131300 [Salix suchowensis]|nr:hypothetical protein IMY05_006G0131300 [Salix suchowensis]